ncbi:hypothetical protein BC834DRAFT_888559 [Gloeopeniophorella convolvens]|nr:hypothetical protein BC834DRAFT_888559 [Gloeopeniophorella convolvens]
MAGFALHKPDLEMAQLGPGAETYRIPEGIEGPGDGQLGPGVPHSVESHNTDEGQEYDERAMKFWSAYAQETEIHDKGLVENRKGDMEGVIIFAGLYSASLTAFLAESYQNLSPDPMQENVFYTKQSVELLAQISAQLAASGSPAPASVPQIQQFPPFRAAQSDVRVNVYWFMSLAFSLSAVLAATLVQQWDRSYIHTSQRYIHPLIRARIRQFLSEGAQRWHVSVFVEAVPALIHISLFLFFLGLADFLFAINTTTAIATTAIISLCALLYLWSIIAPIHDPQSPYQSPISGNIWRMFQAIRRRTYKGYHSTGGARKRVSTNITEGRVQLAMGDSGSRKERDTRAILWVVDTITEDTKLEPFVLGIPGLLSSKWGREVWAAVSRQGRPAPGLAIVPHNTGARHVADLGHRITHLLKTCVGPGSLSSEEERRKRARACVDAALSLVLSTGLPREWFADVETWVHALAFLGGIERIRDPSIIRFDSTFPLRWTCMSLVAASRLLRTSHGVRDAARRVIKCLAVVHGEKDGTEDNIAARTSSIIDQYVRSGWEAADSLRVELNREVEPDKAEERFREIVRNNKSNVAELEYTWNILGWAEDTDEAIIALVRTMVHATGGLLEHFPDVVLQWQHDPRRTPDKDMHATPTHLMPHFIPPRLLVQRLWLCVWAIRNISAAGWGESPSQPKNLGELSSPELAMPAVRMLIEETPSSFEAQMWRLQDLRDGGLVYALELLVSEIRSNKAASHPSSRPLFIGTFRYLTSEWEEHCSASNTQRLLVNLLRQILPETGDGAPSDEIPGYITDVFLTFLGEVLAGKKGSHVAEAIAMIQAYIELGGGTHKVAQEALLAITA